MPLLVYFAPVARRAASFACVDGRAHTGSSAMVHGTPYTPLRISYAWVFSPARYTNPPLSRLSHLPQSSRSLRRMRLTAAAAASSSGKAPWRLLVLPPVLPAAANRGPFCAASHGSSSHAPKVRREPKLPASHTAAEARARFTQPRKGALRRQVHLGG